MEFAAKLKEFRSLMGYTPSEMASYLGMTERGYRYYESGQRKPTLDTLVFIADYFNVSLDELVGRKFSKNVSVKNAK